MVEDCFIFLEASMNHWGISPPQALGGRFRTGRTSALDPWAALPSRQEPAAQIRPTSYRATDASRHRRSARPTTHAWSSAVPRGHPSPSIDIRSARARGSESRWA